MIEELHHFGMMNFFAETDKDHKRWNSNNGNNKLIQHFSDNFDCKISSQNILKQSHSMAVVMAQEHETVRKPLRTLEFI